MKLQFAMDLYDIPEAKKMLEHIQDLIDIIEIGTPMLLRFGLQAVREIKSAFLEKTVLADAKIMDGGKYEADHCFHAGADIVTVMALANEGTFQGTVQSAKEAGGRLLADMMNASELEERAAYLLEAGFDYICVHNATDVLNMDRAVRETEQIVKAVPAGHLAIAGGINPETIGRLKKFTPEILVVGNAIVHADDPRKMIIKLRRNYDTADNEMDRKEKTCRI